MESIEVPQITEKCAGIYSLNTCIEERLESLVSTWAKLVVKRPYIFIVLSLIIGSALTIGLYFSNVNNDVDEIWVPTDSGAKNHKDIVEKAYGKSERRYQIYITSATNNTNLLEVEPFEELITFNSQLKQLNFSGICMKINASNPCRFYEWPLGFWENFDNTIIFDAKTPYQVQYKIQSGKGLATLYPNYDDRYISIIEMLSGRLPYNLTVDSDGSNNIYYFEAMQYEYYTQPNDLSDSEISDWESELRDFVKKFNEKSMYITADLYFLGLVKSDFVDSLSFDLVLYAGAMVFIFLYSFFIIGKCHPTLCRFPLTLAMIISYAVAILEALGIMGYAGFELISSNLAISFFLAIETVLYCSYLVRSIENISIEPGETIYYDRKFVFGFKTVGVSLFKTMLITVTAFSIGSISKFPAISSFCTASAIATIFLYFNCMTLFSACLFYDFKRVLQNKRDCCGQCLCSPKSILCCKGKCAANSLDQEISIFQLFIEYKIVKLLLKKSMIYFVILIYLGIIAAGIAGIFQINQELKVDWLVKNHSSQIKSAIDIKDKYFGDRGHIVGFYMTNTDFSSKSSQLRMIDLSNAMRNCDGCNKKWIKDGTVQSFYDSLIDWVGQSFCKIDNSNQAVTLESGVIPQFWFNSCLQQFLQTPLGKYYSNDLIMKNGSLDTARFSARLKFVSTKSDCVQLKFDLSDISDKGPGYTFPYNKNFLYYAQLESLSNDFLIFCLIVILSAGCYTLFLTVFPSSIVLLVVNILAIELGAIFSMWVLDVAFNVVSVLHLYMIAIVACEFSAHIIHSFIAQPGSKKYRLKFMFKYIGSSLPHVVLSVFIAILAFLIPTESYIFSVWAKIWGSSMAFILFDCFFALPILLSLFGPQTVTLDELSSKVETDENAQRKIEVMDYQWAKKESVEYLKENNDDNVRFNISDSTFVENNEKVIFYK
ncbi:unnamed protein product [Blepharisma stoltei]|uniref:SSD domain-containing protein n=1 Tax=Blepharisma stoltei TaxID=1481888 RepID=A0AAU9KH20_9CILI|nr:unnamed protein product [Blepharisma stoltei]